MSLKVAKVNTIPRETAHTAHAAFPKGNTYITLRDELGVIFIDDQFADLFPVRGQSAISPWRLALITILQFGENMSDRQAADAVRARIDWKYLLGLELSDPGFNFSVLSEFRSRLIDGEAEERLLTIILEKSKGCGLLKKKGRQRTDSTHVISSIRELNRLELVAETLRAALNEIAATAPEWLSQIANNEWYKRYGRRVEDTRLPSSRTKREEYARVVGEDGFSLLEQINASQISEQLSALSAVKSLKIAWHRHYEVMDDSTVVFKTNKDLKISTDKIESPYDNEARYRTKRNTKWNGYMVHLSESCEDQYPHLVTNVHTTPADVHEIKTTKVIHDALAKKDLIPHHHLMDSAYIDPDLRVSSLREHDIEIIGPSRINVSWQKGDPNAYDVDDFSIDWKNKQAICPQGKRSSSWKLETLPGGQKMISTVFSTVDCKVCEVNHKCTKSKVPRRGLTIPLQEEYEAKRKANAFLESDEGKLLYHKRAGVEGTISLGVRSYNMRRSRYRGLAKTHMQLVASAAAMNLDRLASWIWNRPRAKTRESRFLSLKMDSQVAA